LAYSYLPNLNKNLIGFKFLFIVNIIMKNSSLVKKTMGYMTEKGIFLSEPPCRIYTLMNDLERAQKILASNHSLIPEQVEVSPDSPIEIPYLSIKSWRETKSPMYPTELSAVKFPLGKDAVITLHMDGPRFTCKNLEDKHIKGYEYLREKLEKSEVVDLPEETFDILESLNEKHGTPHGTGASCGERELYDVAKVRDPLDLLNKMKSISEAGLIEISSDVSFFGNEYRIKPLGKEILSIPTD
jgi:hypothetical protein